MLWLILLFSVLGGVLSLFGGIALLRKQSWSADSTLTAISFAAGVLLAVSFADLLPEAIEGAVAAGIEIKQVLLWALGAMTAFFLLERSFVWFHHHHGPHEHQPAPLVPMVWIGDTLHNLIDGIVITASFLTSVPLGITTALAVGAHEIPQEIADFSLYLVKRVPKKLVLTLNLLSSLATVAGALAAYMFWESLSSWQPQLLAFTSGMFIYIAGSDLIPELHIEYQRRRVWIQVVTFIVGITVVLLLGSLLAV